MPTKKVKNSNMNLAGIFILFVIGLIFLSILIKIIFLFNESKFNSNHKFNLEIIGNNSNQLVSFSPKNKSISILKLDQKIDQNNISEKLHVPIDGIISVDKLNLENSNISTVLLNASVPFQALIKEMTVIDTFRLFLFSRSISSNSIFERTLTSDLTEAQKSTILTLTFSDPEIYLENQSIQIVNSTGLFGLGSKLASFISNIGGNVVLVSSEEKIDNKSRIIYSGKDSYTVKVLSKFLKFPIIKVNKNGIADVIIIIGTDRSKDLNY